MFSSFVGFVQFAILLAVALILVIAALAFAKTVLSRAFSSGVVQVGSFPDLSDQNKDRAPYLLARAKELFKPVTLDGLYEVKIPPLTTPLGAKDEELKFLSDLKLNIQGVDLPNTIKALISALPDNQAVVSAIPEPAASGSSAVRLEWKEPSGKRFSWPLVSTLPPTDPNATKQIIDKAIYTIAFHLYYEQASSGTSTTGVQFPTSRALEAYYTGRQRLSAYQHQSERPIKTDDLTAAEQEFRILYREMPDFVDGLMLLGITLSENRNEEEAISVFQRVESILENKITTTTLSSGDQKLLFQAKLLHAVASRKLYRWQTNHEALDYLQKLAYEIMPLLPHRDNETTEESFDYLKIYIAVLTERAYDLALDLVLLDEPNFIEALTDDAHPIAGLSMKRELADFAAAYNKATGARLQQLQDARKVAFRDALEGIYGLHGEVLKEARERIRELDTRQTENKRAEERLLSDLYNAEAYGLFRYAQVLERDDGKYLKKCESARRKLHEAFAFHQNDYAILLNFGLVYADPRCDPQNQYMQIAREFLIQSTQLKPTDYYGHQQLARLAIRETYTWGVNLTKPELVADAVKSAEEARRLRPNDGTIFALLAQAYVLQWAETSDEVQRKNLEGKIEASITQAEKYKATPVHVATARAQWLLQQVRRAVGDQLIKQVKSQLLAELDKAIETSKDDESWYGRQLQYEAKELKKTVSELDDGRREQLNWPN